MSIQTEYEAFLHATPIWRKKTLNALREVMEERLTNLRVQDVLGRLWVVEGVRAIDDGIEPFPDADRHLWLVLRRAKEQLEIAYGSFAREGWVLLNVRNT